MYRPVPRPLMLVFPTRAVPLKETFLQTALFTAGMLRARRERQRHRRAAEQRNELAPF
jgi:hypothetical protein